VRAEPRRADRAGGAPAEKEETTTQPNVASAGPLTPQLVEALQRSAGNRAVSGLIQRDDKQVSVADVTVNHPRVTVPLEAGLNLRATVTPANATGVKFKVEKGTVEAKDVQIDASSGKLTIGPGQPGGELKVTAEAADGSSAWSTFRVIEKPTALTSTSPSASGGSRYGGDFTHTFSGPGKSPSGLEDGRINEKFDSLKATSPWGPFDLAANAAGSRGWGLDSSGAMNAADHVTINTTLPDVRPSIQSASNPSPKGDLKKGVGFTMTQHMHAQSLPSGKLDDKAFADIPHVRQLEERSGDVKMVVKAGKDEVEQDYEGKPAFRNAQASPAKVEASPPKPKAERGKPAAAWQRNEVTVTAEAIPSTAKTVFSIVETGAARLGCEIDKTSGVVKIGDQPGTITVRVSDGGTGHYDEVKITITPAAAPGP
jgi:hypothetical protein